MPNSKKPKVTDTASFIAAAKAVHGDKYGYDEVDYKFASKKVPMVCKEHGVFWQTPARHLRGSGCAKCSGNVKLDLPGFIAKSEALHGKDKFDFSEAVYKGNKIPLKLTCLACGHVFHQKPNLHLRVGRSLSGCPKCGIARRSKERVLDRDKVLEKFYKVHGKDRYGYDSMVYKGTDTKVDILCKKCNKLFKQTPHMHASGNGCPTCATSRVGELKRNSYDDFCKAVKDKFGDKYDISEVKDKFVKYTEDVPITCPIHGRFLKAPVTFLRGEGCTKCGEESRVEASRKPIDVLLSEFGKIHKHKYDYSMVPDAYVNSKSTIPIICPVHGIFEQGVRAHTTGQGCPKCAYEDKFITFDEFVANSDAKHKGKYDYSLAKDKYVDTKTKIPIICPEHGVFWQTPSGHAYGYGCRLCSSSSGEKEIWRVLNMLGVKTEHEYRIGKSMYRYDFYLPDMKILLEYHGDQHYNHVKLWDKEKSLEERKASDKAKVLLAKEHKLRLHVYPNIPIPKLEELVRGTIREYYKYSYEGELYATFQELRDALKLDKDVSISKYDKYLI